MIAGIDLAWQSERNTTAVAVGEIRAGSLHLVAADDNLASLAAVQAALSSHGGIRGIAIDAPLIIPNQTGQRPCERLLSRAYGARKAGCHPANLSLYPDAASVRLARHLGSLGFAHLAAPEARWQLECYPHPALIEIFGLPERLYYKKGKVAQRRAGQSRLSRLIASLQRSEVLPLRINAALLPRLHPDRPSSLRGHALKRNEDLLDAIICLYVAGLYALGIRERIYGDTASGYIYVPERRCVSTE